MEFFGVRILGASDEGLRKLALTAAVLVLAALLHRAFRFVADAGLETTSRRSTSATGSSWAGSAASSSTSAW